MGNGLDLSLIFFYKISLQSNALLVNYDDKQVDDKDILGILKKWGCDTNAISFKYLTN